MTTIKATCSECGDVILGVPDVEVHGCGKTEVAWYHFTCPVCEQTVVRSASAPVVDALTTAGCRVVNWTWPPELEVPTAPQITEGDVASFVDALERDGGAAVDGLRTRR